MGRNTKVWFISDTHFFHTNILKYEPTYRPFESLEEMHEVMIDRWNSVVSENDYVFHLGDVVFNGVHRLTILDRLNGKKRLIKGNHDHYKPLDEYNKYFEAVYGCREMNIGPYRAILTHIPVHPQQLHRFHINIHGHLHSNCLDDPRYLNVSVERWNLSPISKETIIQLLSDRIGVPQ